MTIFKRLLPLVPLFLLLVPASSASAITPSPGWGVTQATFPTDLKPGKEGKLEVNIYNVGAAPSSGAFTITDALPHGVSVTRAEYFTETLATAPGPPEAIACPGNTVVVCTIEKYSVLPGEPERLVLSLSVAAGASGANVVTVSGGGASAPASNTYLPPFSSEPAHLGFASFDGWFSNVEGATATQAGSHPYEFTTGFNLDTVPGGAEGPQLPGGEEARNIEFRVPPGVIGDPAALAQCPRQQLDISEGNNTCPLASQIGIDIPHTGETHYPLPVFNMVPPPGMPAQFAFTLDGFNVFLDAAVRTGGDYGITEHIENLPRLRISRTPSPCGACRANRATTPSAATAWNRRSGERSWKVNRCSCVRTAPPRYRS